jgi:hypothetical protein
MSTPSIIVVIGLIALVTVAISQVVARVRSQKALANAAKSLVGSQGTFINLLEQLSEAVEELSRRNARIGGPMRRSTSASPRRGTQVTAQGRCSFANHLRSPWTEIHHLAGTPRLWYQIVDTAGDHAVMGLVDDGGQMPTTENWGSGVIRRYDDWVEESIPYRELTFAE